MPKINRVNLLLPVIALFVPITSAVGAIVDGQQKVRDINGYWTWVSTSAYSGKISDAVIGIAIVIALHILISDLMLERKILRFPTLWLGWILVLALAQLVRGESTSFLITFLSLIVLIACAVRGIRQKDLEVLAYIFIAVALSAAIFALARPERALMPCREDKCTVVNGLLASYFPQENVMGMYFFLGLVVTLFALRGRKRTLGGALLLTLIALSGSRTITVAAIFVLAIAFLMLKFRNAWSIRLFRTITLTVTIILFTLSAVVFFYPLDDMAFTGRGFIYALLRDYFYEQPLLGPGRAVLLQAFQMGQSANFEIAHEHGGMPYILVNSGVIGAVFFLCWIISFARRTLQSADLKANLICSMLFSVAFVSVTEPVWILDIRAPGFWTLMVALCYYIAEMCPPDGRLSAASKQKVEV